MPLSASTTSPASTADLPALATNLQASKLALAINRLLWRDWPAPQLQYENGRKALQGSFEDPLAELWKVVDYASGKVVAQLVLTVRKAAAAGEVKEEKKDESPFNPEVIAEVIEAVKEIRQDWEGKEYLELTHLYVVPAYQRQGHGRSLVNMAIEIAEQKGFDLVVDSEPAACGFFRELRFVNTRHHDFDLAKWAPENSGFGNFRLSGMRLVK